jgi:hypothetical protein
MEGDAMFQRRNRILVPALYGMLAALLAPEATAQSGFDPKPLSIFRASEPRSVKVTVGDGNAARQCAGLFTNSLVVVYESFSVEIRSPDARQVLVFFRDVTFEVYPAPGIITRARMRGKIEGGPFAGATVRMIADARDTGTTYAEVQVVQGAEPRDDVPSWWPSGGTEGSTLDVGFWLMLQRIWYRPA